MKNFFYKKLIVIEIWFALLFITDIILMNSLPNFSYVGGVLAIIIMSFALAYATYQLFKLILKEKNSSSCKDIKQ